MTRQQDVLKGDDLQKIGSVALIVGALLILAGGLLALTCASDVSNILAMHRRLGERRVTAQGAELIMALGFWAAMIGIGGISRSIAGPGAAWARLGFTVIVVGTALFLVGYAMDIAAAAAAATWVAAPDGGKGAADAVLSTITAVGRGTFPLGLVFSWPAFALAGREGSFSLFVILLVSTAGWFVAAGVRAAVQSWRRTA